MGALQFNKEAGHVVEECKLRVVYVAPPQPPSPVAEGSEEGSSPRATMTDNGHLSGSEVCFYEFYEMSEFLFHLPCSACNDINGKPSFFLFCTCRVQEHMLRLMTNLLR